MGKGDSQTRDYQNLSLLSLCQSACIPSICVLAALQHTAPQNLVARTLNGAPVAASSMRGSAGSWARAVALTVCTRMPTDACPIFSCVHTCHKAQVGTKCEHKVSIPSPSIAHISFLRPVHKLIVSKFRRAKCPGITRGRVRIDDADTLHARATQRAHTRKINTLGPGVATP